MEEYKQWLEQQIERCLNDKDLQREHWAFCKAYEKFTALRQPPVICRCYICSKEITDEKDKLEMHGEIVCSQCWDDNMYMALQDGGGC